MSVAHAKIITAIGSPPNTKKTLCGDTGCVMSVIKRTFLNEYHPTAGIPLSRSVASVTNPMMRTRPALLDFYI